MAVLASMVRADSRCAEGLAAFQGRNGSMRLQGWDAHPCTDQQSNKHWSLRGSLKACMPRHVQRHRDQPDVVGAATPVGLTETMVHALDAIDLFLTIISHTQHTVLSTLL